MIKINVEFDENDLILYIKEAWYRDGRREAKNQMKQLLEEHVKIHFDNKIEEFDEILLQAMKDVLKEFRVREVMYASRDLKKGRLPKRK